MGGGGVSSGKDLMLSEGYDEDEPDSNEEIGETTNHYHDKVDLPKIDTVARVTEAFNADGSVKRFIKATKSDFVHNLVFLDGVKFDFTGREYLLPIYNRNDHDILLKTARQVEKCSIKSTTYLKHDGSVVTVEDLRPGDKLVAFDERHRPVIARVKAVAPNGVQQVVKITTRERRSTTCTLNHPFRTLFDWTPARDLLVGDFIGLPHRAGRFGHKHCPLEAEFVGLMLAKGILYENSAVFTQNFGPALDRFLEVCSLLDVKLEQRRLPSRPSIASVTIRSGAFELFDLISPHTDERSSGSIALPGWAFDLDHASAAALLRGLWAGDGHCKNVRDGKIDLCYSTTSKELVGGIERLLLKFGIFSQTRINKPTLCKNTDKVAYVLSVIGSRSIRRFFREIGPIPGKLFTLKKECVDKDQSDIIPKEVGRLIRKIVKERGSRVHSETLFADGLRSTPEYNLQRDKFLKYCEFFDDARLWDIYHGEVYWDKIESIEVSQPEETFAVEMEEYYNFVTDGIITHNTTFLANNLVVSSVVQPYNKSLYVSPSHTQTRQFSNEKLRPAIEKSPFIKRYFQDHSVSTQVFEKGFTNGSYVFLRSAFRSADRTRGISARNLALDEIQDMLGSEIPVIMECTSHFPDANRLMAGTPKSLNNPIEAYWQETSQNEWLVPCSCGKWNFLDETNIAPTEMYLKDKLPPGPVCKKCMKPLNVRAGRWMTTCSGKLIQGYRIPQLMVPWIIGLKDQWMRILWKRDNYPLGQLYNEVLGLSYDSASKPITRDQLIDLCQPYDLWDPENLTPENLQESHGLLLTAGVDWGEGNDGTEKSPTGKIRNASYTVLTIGAYINQKTWSVKLVKKYEGREVDPDHVVKDIARICRVLNVQLVGVDWGHGWGVNNHLTRLMSPQNNPRIVDAYGKHKVVQFQYLPKLKQRMKWDPTGFRYHLQRNFMMSELFFDMKHGFIQFPRWAQIERYAKDVLAIFAEYVEYRREMKYDHRSTDPDDWFHSLHYAKLASDILSGKSRRYTLDIPQE